MMHEHNASRAQGLPAQIGNVPDGDPIGYKGQPVMTTELMAKSFGAGIKQISDNFANNSARFVEGVHFHKVHGPALKALKNEPDYIGLVGKTASHLLLWTERGVARHAKILDTDTAWEIFEQLEDTYFSVKAGLSLLKRSAQLREVEQVFSITARMAKLAGLKDNAAILSAALATKRETGTDPLEIVGRTHLPAPANLAMINPKTIGDRLGGRSAQDVNKDLIHHGFQRSFRDDKRALHYEPTEKGVTAGGQMMDTGKKQGGRMIQQLLWPSSIVETLRRLIFGGM
ncbi:ORF6N domain-containing protein [Devosia limi DSM 17137]|nr:ORF6N domain-containing protein [Devosia limi DSM 17137]